MGLEALKVGDIVQLKSGGPPMTYDGDLSSSVAICSWFDSKHQVHKKPFPKTSLLKIQPPQT